MDTANQKRKELLRASAALQRQEIAAHASALRAGLRFPRVVMTLIALPPVRTALLGVVMGAVGKGKLSRMVGGAVLAYAVVRIGVLLLKRGDSGPKE